MGGLWRSTPETTRLLAEALRVLAHGDPSVALVSSMHPAVLQPYVEVRDEAAPGWLEQRRWIFETALGGSQWGTIVSEPGSGGDMRRTKAELTLEGANLGAAERPQALRQRLRRHVLHGHDRPGRG